MRYHTSVTTADELLHFAEATWVTVSVQAMNSLCDSALNRKTTVIDARDGCSRYWFL